MGCDVTSLDLLHSNHIQDVIGRNENYISFGKSETASEEHNDDGTKNEMPPNNHKLNMGIFTREGEGSEIYVRCFDSLRGCTKAGGESLQQYSKRVESESSEGTAMGLEFCPNSGTIRELQASVGELFRVGTFRSVTWTKEVPNETCCLVYPHPNPARGTGKTSDNQGNVSIMSNCGKDDVLQEGRNRSLMVVDTFASEQDRRRIALTYGHDLPNNSRDPKELTYYIKCVAEFGFSHIIII